MTSQVSRGILEIAGDLDIESAATLRRTLLDFLAQRGAEDVALGGVESCDAAALQVLLAIRKQLRLTGIPEPVLECAGALGITLDNREGLSGHAA